MGRKSGGGVICVTEETDKEKEPESQAPVCSCTSLDAVPDGKYLTMNLFP